MMDRSEVEYRVESDLVLHLVAGDVVTEPNISTQIVALEGLYQVAMAEARAGRANLKPSLMSERATEEGLQRAIYIRRLIHDLRRTAK